jgi:uncharacterized protein
MILSIVGWTALGLTVVVALILDILGLFGNWLMLAAFGALWALTGFEHFGPWGLGGMVAFAVLGEILETALAGYGAKRFGGSKGSMVAALVGCMAGAVAGTPLFPVVGTLFGACAGAFIGAAVYEYLQQDKEIHAALWTGLGAAAGKIGGIFAKLFCGVAIIILAWLSY